MTPGGHGVGRPAGDWAPEWGPYAKAMAGLSHVDAASGTSVDFLLAFRFADGTTLLPVYRSVENPDDGASHGFRFHGARPGLRRFGYRFRPEASADGPEVEAVADSAGGRCDLRLAFRETGRGGGAVCAELLAVRPPELRPSPELLLPGAGRWIGGEAYAAIQTWGRHAYDGYRNMVEGDPSAVDGCALGRNWSILPGTRVAYAFPGGLPGGNGRLGIRYRKPLGGPDFPCVLEWGAAELTLDFPPSETYRWLWLDPPEAGDAGRFVLRVEADAGVAVRRTQNGDPMPPGFRIDGFAWAPREEAEAVALRDPEAALSTEVEPEGDQWRCAFGTGAPVYRLDLPRGARLSAPGDAGLFGRAMDAGAVDERDVLAHWRLPEAHATPSAEGALSLVFATEEAADEAPSLPADEAPGTRLPNYAPGFRQMANSALMNASFPVMRAGRPIIAHTPGKRWAGLYSWDAGMHGIGLLELDPDAAFECLKTYLCGPEEPSAFIWHGTPVPTQAYFWWEWWQRRRDRETAVWVYPRLKRFYDYLSGRDPGSPTDRFGTGLLNTFPIFYNSGGWDDLPPQVAAHARDLVDHVTPVAPTAHAVRFARILRHLAETAERPEGELAGLDADIGRFLRALERTWDAGAGLYSYVWHETFEPFRDAGGVNFNRTLDAMIPLMSGGIDGGRAALLWDRLRDPEAFLTPMGFATVDRSAPYYDPNGYANGAVWIPYQWFLWKAALDQGVADFAIDLPRRVVESWDREVGRHGRTCEHFRAETGEAAGYPHFAGLSAPILQMIAALTEAGRVTAGFDVEVRNVTADSERVAFEARVSGAFGENPLVLVVLPWCGSARKWIDGSALETVEPDANGCVSIAVERGKAAREGWADVVITKGGSVP